MTQSPRTVELDTELYPLAALDRTLAAYAAHCEADVVDGPIVRMLQIRPMAGAPPTTTDEFLSYLLCAALDIHLCQKPEGNS
jgi:hypothetical protein